MRPVARVALGLTIVLSLLVGLTTVVEPVDAETSSAANPVARRDIDGCTLVPDSGPTFNFTEACLVHDSCYVDQPYGSTRDARKRCDKEFYSAMVDACNDRWAKRSQRWKRRTCKAVASVYYLGVRAVGGWFFEHQQEPALAAKT